MAGVLGGEPSTAASRLHGRRGNMSGLMAGLSDEQALHAQQQRQKLLQDLEIQVRIQALEVTYGELRGVLWAVPSNAC